MEAGNTIKPTELLPSFTAPEYTDFTPDRILERTDVLPMDEIESKMAAANLDLTGKDVSRIALGEKNRIFGVRKIHKLSYEDPRVIGLASGVLPVNYTVAEMGASLGAHYAIMDHSVQPAHVDAVDNQPHIVAAAQVAQRVWKEKGFIRPDSVINIMKGDENTHVPKADLAYASLLTQYVGAEPSLRWGVEHGRLAVNSDVAHGRTLLSEQDYESNIFEIRTRNNRNEYVSTGAGWLVEGTGYGTPIGRIYDASLVLDPNVFNSEHVRHLRVNNDSYRTKILVTEKDGQHYFQGWTFEGKVADEAEYEEIGMMLDTLADIYPNVSQVTQGKENWDGNAQFGIPLEVIRQQLYSVVRITTHPDVSGNIIPVILMRHNREMEMLAPMGHLSLIGDGKKFSNLGEFYKMVSKWLSPQAIDSKFKISIPPFVTTMTTSDKDIFEAILQTASAA